MYRNFSTKRVTNFIDLSKILVSGGQGGAGACHFSRQPFEPIVAPDGGNGGRGGHIWIRVDGQRSDLSYLAKFLVGGKGGKGQDKKGKGSFGKDIVIDVPKGTIVKEILPKLTPKGWLLKKYVDGGYPHEPLYIDTSSVTVGSKFLICTGGVGGRGNYSFLTPANRSPMDFEEGQLGQTRYLELELKTLADVGLVGLPNSGKSTFLSQVTNSKTAVGHWAFTTLRPFLGTIHFQPEIVYKTSDGKLIPSQNTIIKNHDENTIILPDFDFSIADIPGIIRGAASENKGIGHAFLRHIEKAKLLVYVVDLSSRDVIEDLETLTGELKTFNAALISKAGLVIANKADIFSTDPENPNVTQNSFKALKLFMKNHSIYKDWSVIPVSSKYGQNISKVVWELRFIMENIRKKEETLKTMEDWTNNEHIRGVHEIVSND